MRIMVIDDDNQMLSLYKDVLGDLGEIVCYSDPMEAHIEIINNKDSIDLIISDYGMPGMNGGEMLRIIRNHLRVPVIMISGSDIDCQEIGYISFLRKPFRIKQLQGLVHQLTNTLAESVCH